MNNLFESDLDKTFYCWVDHEFAMADHNYQIGAFFSANLHPKIKETNDALMFIPNDNFNGQISPFQMRLLNSYLAEYNLELSHRQYFKKYPNRLSAIFLFESEAEANKYRDRHFDHVRKRALRKVKTKNRYKYSRHDSSWIDFLRCQGWKDRETIYQCCASYWKGEIVKNYQLSHFGSTWSEEPIFEILYDGMVSFIKNLNL